MTESMSTMKIMDDDGLVRELGSSNRVLLARISMGVDIPEQPSLPFVMRRLAMGFDKDMHPLFKVWSSDIEPQLIELLNNTALNAQMSYLTVVRVGFKGLPKEECPLTILIAVQPGSMDPVTAQKLLDQVAPIVYQTGVCDDVCIEVIQAQIALHDTDDSDDPVVTRQEVGTAPGYPFYDAFTAKPVPGVGIGMEGAGCATHGGYVEIRLHSNTRGMEDKVTTMALTCHHTFSKHEAAMVSSAGSTPIVVHCPPKHDSAAWRAHLEQRINQIMKSSHMKMLQIKSDGGDAVATKRRDALLHKVAEKNEQLVVAKTFDTRFGEVYCTSGIKNKSGWITDWGLVKLDLRRLGDLEGLSSALTYDAVEHFLCFSPSEEVEGHGGIVPHEELERRINNFEDYSQESDAKQRQVFKCGRTTGKTYGRLEKVGATVWMRYKHGTMIGKVLLVVPPAGHITFGAQGDSGSLIYDYKGNVIGMYFGGQDCDLPDKVAPLYNAYDSIDGIHLIIPINVILDDIRDTFGRLYPAYESVSVNMLW